MIRIGVDLGGTKIEAIAIDAAGNELARRRIASPSRDYAQVLAAVASLVRAIEGELGARALVGIGTPGAISAVTGAIKNANSTVLNGRPFAADLARALEREIRIENDANCFALSEAIDGAAAGASMVFGVILGTGAGGGIVHDGRVWLGANAIAGEWAHNELPLRGDPEPIDTLCYCGRRRCIETFVSGPAIAADHARRAPAPASAAALDAAAIAALAEAGDAQSRATLDRFYRRLASALAVVVNVLDPEVVVIGGGVSRIKPLCAAVAARLPEFVFSDRIATRVVTNRHGDASGVRGAAWLWSP